LNNLISLLHLEGIFNTFQMIRATLCLLSYLLCFNAFSQEVDTTYFNQNNIEVAKNDVSVFRYDVTSTKGKSSSIHRYSMNGTLLEIITLTKNKKDGLYYFLDLPDSIKLEGKYKRDIPVGKWTTEYLKEGHSFVDIYSPEGFLISRDGVLGSSIQAFEIDELDTKPDYATGENGWNQHLMKHLTYPREAVRSGTQGGVELRLTILSSGRVAKAEVTNDDVDEYLAKEAIRVALISDNWSPGIKNGNPVNSYMYLKIMFRLK